MELKLETQCFPLPETVRQAIEAGFIDMALIQIDRYLKDNRTPQVMRERLELEKSIISRRKSDYPYTYEVAEALLEKEFPLYKKGMLEEFTARDLISWCYVNGEIHYEERILENAAKRCCELTETKGGEDPDLKARDEFIKLLEAHGEVKARIEAVESITIDKSYAGKKVFVNLPLPRFVKDQQEEIEIKETSANIISVDDEDAPMRTAQGEAIYKEGMKFSVRFAYTITARKNNPVDSEEKNGEEEKYLKEQLPHIAFTPYLKALANEITEGKSSLKEKAEAIYYWVTEHVDYSFMREYATIDCISEYAASGLKGDCGVQALLFITLCRIAGIPARWQSGWYITPSRIGNHDWAEFLLGGKWYNADCSFGGGAFRSGNEKRHKHYFGSLDIFRMIANSETCGLLSGKKAPASDPTDNQRGEVETEGKMVPHHAFENTREVLSFDILK